MTCEILECCQFCQDTMKELPKAAEYIQKKFCLGDHEGCIRYRIYKEFGREPLSFDLYPDDAEEMVKIARCLKGEQLSEG